jgi:hypothetical protein
LQYGEWMLATHQVSTSVEPRCFAPREPVCGGWYGRGGLNQNPRKRSSQNALLDKEEESGESGESPLKSIPIKEKVGPR